MIPEEEKLKNLIDRANKTIGLTKEGKGKIRSRLVSFMARNPLPGFQRPKGVFAFFQNVPALKYASAFSLLLVVLCVSSVSLAAQNALPGDLLYSVKVGVNEKVLGIVQFSDESRAKYEVHLAEVRLQELEKTVAKEQLNETTSQEINTMLALHIEKAQKKSNELEDRNEQAALQIHSDLEASLKAHKEVLKKLSEKDGQTIKNVLSNFDNNISSVEKGREDSEGKFVKKASDKAKQDANSKLAAAETRISEVDQKIENTKSSLTESSYVSAKANLKIAQDIVIEGKTKLESENYKEAFLLFQKATRVARETEIGIKASLSLKVAVPDLADDRMAAAGAGAGTEASGAADHDDDNDDKNAEERSNIINNILK